MAVTDTLINTLFDGRYLVLRKLGSGGMAEVYLAEDQELGRRVAIKVLNDRHANDDQFVERFRREAKNAAGLSHPNVVSIYDRGEAEGTYYIAMEYLGGQTLKQLVATRGPAPIPTAIEYTRQILSGLSYAHRHGIVHRDIKPHNVVVDEDGRLKVTDFGIARGGASQMTEIGSIIGTAQYLSPEQARGTAVDQRSDLYSVGIVLYELLTGQPPFSGDTPLEIAMKHISTPPPPPSSLRPEIPRDLELVVLRSLAKNSAERYATAQEMEAELAQAGSGLGVSAETEEAATAILTQPLASAPTMVTRGPPAEPPVPRAAAAYDSRREPYYAYEEPRRRRRPLWPWVLAAALIAAAAIGVFLGWNTLQDQLNAAKPVAVPDVVGIPLPLAKLQLQEAHLKPKVHRRPNADVAKGVVIRQQPDAGTHTDRDNPVDVFVSTGLPRVEMPDLRGSTRAAATGMLENAGLKPRVVQVFSEKPTDTVTGQYPPPGTSVVKGATVRVNVSRGARPLSVPYVVGQDYGGARSTLQSAGFSVEPLEVDSNQPKDTVLSQNPAAGTAVAKGQTVTLTVSKGPTTAIVPDVTRQDEKTAKGTLKQSGFKVKVLKQPPSDPSLVGLVIDQDPRPGATATSGTAVTIVVGEETRGSGTGPLPPR